jgi:hypothetical protein
MSVTLQVEMKKRLGLRQTVLSGSVVTEDDLLNVSQTPILETVD